MFTNSAINIVTIAGLSCIILIILIRITIIADIIIILCWTYQQRNHTRGFRLPFHLRLHVGIIIASIGVISIIIVSVT